MNATIILRAVPEADPAFLRLMMRLPDPPEAAEQLEAQLKTLYVLFEEKRRAAEQVDEMAWSRVVQKEIRLIASADIV